MQAILTKYIGPTNAHGARIRAQCERGSITIPWPGELDIEAAHVAAAQALCEKFAEEDAARYGKAANKRNPWLAQRYCGGLNMKQWHYAHVFKH
jgi:hypothetical protein